MMQETWDLKTAMYQIEVRDEEIAKLQEYLTEHEEIIEEMKSERKSVVHFLKSLLNPEELGWAVSQEVRDIAKKELILLGEFK